MLTLYVLRGATLQIFQHGPQETGIKSPHLVAFVPRGYIRHLSGRRFQHCQRLVASVQIASYNSHSACLGPSAVRVNGETV